MVLKLSTVLFESSISILFEESNQVDLSKLEREIKNKENEVTKEITNKVANIDKLKRQKLELINDNTNMLKQLNLKKQE